MCCSTGVCGPSIDPALARFAADLDWLQHQGVKVERFGLSSDPGAFVANAAVTQALTARGTACLPLILVDGQIAVEGSYPGSREDLARLAGVPVPESLSRPRTLGRLAVVAPPAACCDDASTCA
jgi:hypothetical protein